jgi:hypothetical protein
MLAAWPRLTLYHRRFERGGALDWMDSQQVQLIYRTQPTTLRAGYTSGGASLADGFDDAVGRSASDDIVQGSSSAAHCGR